MWRIAILEVINHLLVEAWMVVTGLHFLPKIRALSAYLYLGHGFGSRDRIIFDKSEREICSKSTYFGMLHSDTHYYMLLF